MDKNIGIMYLQVLYEAMRMGTHENTRRQRKEFEEN